MSEDISVGDQVIVEFDGYLVLGNVMRIEAEVEEFQTYSECTVRRVVYYSYVILFRELVDAAEYSVNERYEFNVGYANSQYLLSEHQVVKI